MPVYKFSHHLLAVLVHLAHTAVKWKTNFLILDVGDKLVNTTDTDPIKYEKKFIQKAVSIMYTVFSFKKEHGRCFHPKSLLRRSKSRALAPRLLYVSITLFTVPVIEYDASVGVSVTEKIRCTVLFLCPLHYNAVTGILHELCWHARLCGSSVSGLQVILAGGTRSC